MAKKTEQLDNEPLLYERVVKLEGTVHVLETLVKTMYDQQVAQERAFQSLRKQFEQLRSQGWTRG